MNPIIKCIIFFLSWLRDNLNLIDSIKDIDALTQSVENCGDVYFVPAFSGLYAPYWNQEARGYIFRYRFNRFCFKRNIFEGSFVASLRILKMDIFYGQHWKRSVFRCVTF